MLKTTWKHNEQKIERICTTQLPPYYIVKRNIFVRPSRKCHKLRPRTPKRTTTRLDFTLVMTLCLNNFRNGTAAKSTWDIIGKSQRKIANNNSYWNAAQEASPCSTDSKWKFNLLCTDQSKGKISMPDKLQYNCDFKR